MKYEKLHHLSEQNSAAHRFSFITKLKIHDIYFTVSLGLELTSFSTYIIILKHKLL